MRWLSAGGVPCHLSIGPFAALSLVLGCGGDGTGPDVRPAAIQLVSGSEQSAPAGAQLPGPLVVRVSDASAAPLQRAVVRWRRSGGSLATLSSDSSLTDAAGQAKVFLTLGPAAGSYAVSATAAGLEGMSVGFTATATEPPRLSSVSPASFGGGDTLRLAGSNLSPQVAANEVSVGGAPAKVVSATASGLVAIAPSCLPAGAVSVSARSGGAPTNTVAATFVSRAAPIALGAGDYLVVAAAQVAGCVQFAAPGGSGVEYLLAPQFATATADVRADFQLGGAAEGTAAVLPAAVERGGGAAQAFHDMLRSFDRRVAAAGRGGAGLEALGGPALAAEKPSVGSQRSFKVCGNVDACTPLTTVTATARYVGSHAAIYLDNEAPAGGLTDGDVAELGALFDSDLYGVAVDAFGSESDLDRNGVVVILLTKAVNLLVPRPQCEQSFIAGFFLGADIAPDAPTRERFNNGEVFYGFVPDPSGTVACSRSVSTMKRIVPATFIHEFQHMISFNQHVLLRGGDTEVLWLSEGLAHLAEELGGRYYQARGVDSTGSRMLIGNLFNAFGYLKAPSAVAMVTESLPGTLEQRGAEWLFVRYLVDQFGDGMTRRLVETSLTGAANLEAATRRPLGLLLARWALALYLSDLSAFTAPPELRYSSWSFRGTYASLNSQFPKDFDRPFPLVPTLVSAPSFTVNGGLASGSAGYVRVALAGGASGFAVSLNEGSGGPLPAAGIPQLLLVRVR